MDDFEKYLGDIVVAPQYVYKQCLRDKYDFEVLILLHIDIIVYLSSFLLIILFIIYIELS
jgi:hypothetical protein